MGVLEGKVALITGAGRGFGAATAERFLEEGATVALNYRRSKGGCEALLAKAQELGRKAILVEGDVTDPTATSEMVSRVVDELGRIDILVNNAGIMHLSAFIDSTEDAWRDELEVNVFGTLRVTQLVLPHMVAQRYGKVINLSSQLALVGWDRGAVYSGSKGFILTWTKSLAQEVGQHNINVNAIAPGSIVTDMNKDIYPTEAAAEQKAAELPLRRLGSPVDVAECAVFLASESSSFLTGQLLGPNGGNVM